ncbi:hypothetical protein AURDEDRAFT_151342 [Auricularia subglabra TFB-10046 SS5]|nr:hypothetical protein AURDEDRAFT_151342 [Auricularia subglabra TFB-10046 SS5]
MFAPPHHADLARRLVALVQRERAAALVMQDVSLRLEGLRRVHLATNAFARNFFRALNASAPVNCLPPDVLARVFFHTSSADLPSIVRVCRRWTDVARGEQDLWTRTICVSGKDGMLPAAGPVLALFPSAPIALDLTVFNSSDWFAALALEHLFRIRELVVDVFMEDVTADRSAAVRPLLCVLEEPWPLLQRFELILNLLPFSAVEEIYVPDGLFAHSAPCLSHVALRGIGLRDRPYAALSGVRYLQVTQYEVNFVRLLDFYPRLEELSILTLLLVAGRRKVNPHNLQFLQIPLSTSAMREIDLVYSRLVVTKPLTVWLTNNEHADSALLPIVSTAPKRTMRKLEIYVHFGEDYSVYGCALTYRSNLKWVFLADAVDTARIVADADIMANLRVLALHEFCWPTACAFQPAPQLTRLDVALHGHPAPDPAVPPFCESVGLFCESPPALECPALAELRLTAPGRYLAPSVDVYDVCAFLQTRVRCGAAPRLVLRNVHLYDPALGAGMRRLTSLVADIQYRATPPPRIPRLHEQEHAVQWLHERMLRATTRALQSAAAPALPAMFWVSALPARDAFPMDLSASLSRLQFPS